MTAGSPAVVPRPRRGSRHPQRDRRLARRDAVRRGGRRLRQDQALVDRIVALSSTGPSRARDRGGHVHREGGGRARDRIRRALEAPAHATPIPSPRPAATGARGARRLRGVTLHAFAQRILAEHPVEAGLRRASRCSTTSRRSSRSRNAGAASSTSCSTTPARTHHPPRARRRHHLDGAAHAGPACDANWDLVAERCTRSPIHRRSTPGSHRSSTRSREVRTRALLPRRPTTSSSEGRRPRRLARRRCSLRPTSTSSCDAQPRRRHAGTSGTARRPTGPPTASADDVQPRSVRSGPGD